MDAILHTLLYLGIGLGVLAIGVVLFTLTTKMNEQKLILESESMAVQVAVSLKLAGKILGLILVISSAAKYSVDVMDYVYWSAFGVIAQILGYWLVEHAFFPKVSLAKKVEEGKVGVAIILFAFSLAVGGLISGAISWDPALELLNG